MHPLSSDIGSEHKPNIQIPSISSRTQSYSQDQYEKPSAIHPETPPQRINWHIPAAIIILFILGMTAGIGHYMFYSWKDGGEAGDEAHQRATNRGGSYLAYTFGILLATMVSLARDQWLWYNLRNDSYTLKSINAMFGVISNPLKFLNLDVLSRAKVSTIMAMVKWLIPLSAALTPGTLTVSLQDVRTDTTCTVPTLRFDYEGGTDTDSIRISQLNCSSCTYLSEIGSDKINPSPRARQIFIASASSGRIMTADYTSLTGTTLGTDCVSGSCSYLIKFDGPSIDCTAKSLLDVPSALQYTEYFSTCDPAQNLSDVQVPIFHAQRSTEPQSAMWLLHTLKDHSTNELACRKPYAYICQPSVSRYSVTMVINNYELQEPEINNIIHLYSVTEDQPILSPTPYNGSAIYDERALNDSVVESVHYSTVEVQDTTNLPNWVLFDTILEMMEGEWTVSSPGISTTNHSTGLKQGWHYTTKTTTRVGSTSLIGEDGYPVSSLGKSLERMANKMVVSLLSDPTLIYAANMTTTCTSNHPKNLYKFNSSSLILTYAIGLSVSSLMALLGFAALRLNGMGSDSKFSTILLTTRNKDLDEMSKGGCFGTNPLPEAFDGVRLKFGDIGCTNDGQVGHAAIGVDNGSMSDISKEKTYK